MENTTKLFKMLLLESTGETYEGESFAEYCEEWLKQRASVSKPATLTRYSQVMRSFISSLPEHRKTAEVAAIGTREIRMWREKLVSEGLSESTCNVALTIIRGLFGDARRQGILVVNPAEALPMLRATSSDERIPFTVEQVQALLAAADDEWRGMTLIGFFCGLRISDASDLLWSNIDLLGRTLSYEQKKVSHRRKRKDRITQIYLHDDVMDYLTKIAGSDDPNGPLFPSLHGLGTAGPYGLSGQFVRLMAKAGIEAPRGVEKIGRGRVFRRLSFHSLRHSFVSRLANAEISMEIRKQMSGHSSDAVHEGYSHLSIELQKSAVQKLTSVL